MLTTMGWILLAAAALMGRVAFRTRRSAERDLPAEVTAGIASSRASMTSQVRALEVQLLEQTPQLEAELDARRMMLDQLIAEADQKIADLEDRIDAAANVPVQPQLRRAA